MLSDKELQIILIALSELIARYEIDPLRDIDDARLREAESTKVKLTKQYQARLNRDLP